MWSLLVHLYTLTPLEFLAQTQAPTPPFRDVIGPYGALVLALGCIGYLAKQLAEERKARNELAERLVSQAEKIVPILEANNRALDDSTKILERMKYLFDQQERRP